MNRSLRIVMLAGATLALFSPDVGASGSLSNWRAVARSARANLAEHRYGAAEQGYLSALQLLSEQNARAEEIFDLKLLLVETYRLEKQYGKAEELLRSIEPAITTSKFADPTIAVRFWRRRAELRCSEQRFNEGIDCMKRAIAILEKYFQPNSATLLSNYTLLLRLACQELDWQTITSVLNKLRPERSTERTTQSRQVITARQAADLRQTRTLALLLVSERASKLLTESDYKTATLLYRLIANEGDAESGVRVLTRAMQEALMKKQYKEVDAIVPFLYQLLDHLNPKADGSTSLRIEGHAALACMYEVRGLRDLQLLEWKKVYELHKTQGSKSSFSDQYHSALARNRIATVSEFKPDGATEYAMKLISESVKFSALPPSSPLLPAQIHALNSIHVDSRICYSWACATRKEWMKSESCLDSINAEAFSRQADELKLSIAGLRLSVADYYLGAGNTAGCRRNLALAKSALASIPDSPKRKATIEKLETMMKTTHLKPSKAASGGSRNK